MLLLVVAWLLAFLVVFVSGKRIAFALFFNPSLSKLKTFTRATLILAGVSGMAGHAAGGGVPTNPESFTSLRLVTLDEVAQVELQKRIIVSPAGLTAAGYQAKAHTILVRKAEVDELRQQIRFELRCGNITAEKATSLNALIDEIDREGKAAKLQTSGGLIAAQEKALAELRQSQAQLNETLADTEKLVKALDVVRSREFTGTLIAAKIQVVRLLAEKAAVDGSIDEIGQYRKRPKNG